MPTIALLALLLFGQDATSEASPAPSALDLPRLQLLQTRDQALAAQLIAAKNFAAAETKLREAIKRVPHDFNAHYNLACCLAVQGKTDDALASLATAVETGFRNRQHLEQDEDLKSLRDEERFQELLKQADTPLEKPVGWQYKIEPAMRDEQGKVVIGEANLGWRPRPGLFQAVVSIPPVEDRPAIAKGLGEVGDLLRKWNEDGTAAGNYGDLYDNRDRDHSNMNYAAFPQLTRVEFAEEVKQRRMEHGLQMAMLFNAPTIGNSSTALTSGHLWRSQPRMALTSRGGAERLYLQYRANHLYFYPEHRDHDPGRNGNGGYGDVYAANTPYMVISQGSSGSDRAFLNAVAATLAAFRPAAKEKLTKSGMLIPTVQMILRRTYKLAAEPGDYLTGKAHPTVFEGKQLDVPAMLQLAHGMTADSLPPLVQLSVVEEDDAVLGVDYFDVSAREAMFTTPSAIARVAKSTKYTRRMVLSAEQSIDLNGKPLTYRWTVLRGDADRIEIKPLNDNGSVVELRVPYHHRTNAAGDGIVSNRVDIGAFVHNGEYFSAPGIISIYYLDNEKRVYDDQQRIVTVDYTNPEYKANYVDPLIDIRKDWRDEYHYADDGSLSGWTRIRGEDREEFSADGRLVLSRGEDGTPSKTVSVRYTTQREGNKLPLLVSERVERPEP